MTKRPRKEKIPNHTGEPTGKRPSGFVESDVVGAHHHENQNALKRPWQRALAAYEIREGAIYLRKYNVKLATFYANSALLRDTLAKAFDAAHAQIESERDQLTKLPRLRSDQLTKLPRLRSDQLTKLPRLRIRKDAHKGKAT